MSQDVLPYAPVILKLLQGVLYYSDERHWELLRSYEQPLQQYFAAIGLALQIDVVEGYAFLVQPDPDDDSAPALPRLVRRSRLSYDATLLCVLLREALQQHDTREPDQPRLVLSKSQLQERLQLFYPEQSDETRLATRLGTIVGQVERAGFLRRLGGTMEEEQYEVLRIIKAKLSADQLAELRDRLRDHAGKDE